MVDYLTPEAGWPDIPAFGTTRDPDNLLLGGADTAPLNRAARALADRTERLAARLPGGPFSDTFTCVVQTAIPAIAAGPRWFLPSSLPLHAVFPGWWRANAGTGTETASTLVVPLALPAVMPAAVAFVQVDIGWAAGPAPTDGEVSLQCLNPTTGDTTQYIQPLAGGPAPTEGEVRTLLFALSGSSEALWRLRFLAPQAAAACYLGPAWFRMTYDD